MIRLITASASGQSVIELFSHFVYPVSTNMRANGVNLLTPYCFNEVSRVCVHQFSLLNLIISGIHLKCYRNTILLELYIMLLIS